MSGVLPAPAILGAPVSLAGRINIYPASPWSALDNAAGPAYAAQLPNDTSPEPLFYAIVGKVSLPPRGDALTAIRGFSHPNLMRFVDYGVVDWPGHGPVSTYIFTAPPGQRLSQIYGTQQRTLDDEQVGQRLKPLFAMVRAFGSTNFSHGNLSLSNLYMGPAGIVGGECASTPPSYNDGGYLTIERSQADPAARGAPNPPDDMYAIGMVAIALGLGIDPVANVPPERLLANKLNHGSYNALLGAGETTGTVDRLRGGTAELARGLLEDSPSRRWTMDDAEAWLAGRHPTVRQSLAERTASRPFQLPGVPGPGTFTRRATAHLLASNMAAATVAISNGELHKWVQRTLDDEDLAKALDSDLAQQRRSDSPSAPMNTTATPQQVGRAILLLDPDGPVRYRDARVMPSGYGSWLSMRMQQSGDLQVPGELMASGLLTRWLQQQPENRAEHLRTEQQIEKARGFLERRQIGYGIERALYELMPAQYCLSPLVRHARASAINPMLAALEKNPGNGDPIDRHIAAFLVARDKRLTAGLLVALVPAGDAATRAIGMLTLLSEAQYRHGPASMPNLARWLTRQLEPAIQRYKRPSTQKRMRGQLEEVAAKGNLAELVQLIDNPETLLADQKAYRAAKENWLRAEREIEELETDIENKADIETRLGQPIASGIAVVLGLVAMAFAIVMSMRGSLL